MIDLDTLVAALGGGLLHLLVPGRAAGAVADVAIAEPGEELRDVGGDLVFGVGLTGPGPAAELLRQAAAGQAAGVVLRRTAARARGVRTAARRHGVALLELDDDTSLVHVIGLVRGIVDRAVTAGLEERPGTGGQSDLLTLADAAASLVNAPVTIEDAQSRVLAYSSRQDVTDTARVSTIVGRRVPAALVAHMRSKGVFRRMARSDEPFLVAPGPGQEMPRYVVPVRAGGEWLGSIWAVVAQPPPPDVVTELRQAATVVALHLIRVRALADLGRRVSSDRLRALLAGGPAMSTSWLAPGPWRVVVLGEVGAAVAPDPGDSRPQAVRGAAADVELWESALRRAGWRQPAVTDLDDEVLAVVQATGHRPGSWAWLESVVRSASGSDLVGLGAHRACAGQAVRLAVDLPRSRAEASELALLPTHTGLQWATTAEEQWAALGLARAAGSLGPVDRFCGPVPLLGEHDSRQRTAYLPSLAAWLDHPGEPTAAARALGVHVNTLRHRMSRMSEVADLPLDDPEGRIVLRLQLKALGH